MEQLIAAQAQLTQVIAQFMANNNGNNGNNNNNPPPHVDALTRFLRLRPVSSQVHLNQWLLLTGSVL
jgi:hypothetical protein